MRRTGLIASVGLVFLAASAGVAQASRIIPLVATPAFLGGGLGTGTGLATTVAPNNNNSNPSTNTIVLIEEFDFVANIDAVFNLTPTGGRTEYFTTVTVTNNTGVNWTDFHFELLPNVSDTLTFDLPQADPTPTSTAFTDLVHLEDTIDWSGGSIPNGGVGVFTLSIDTPDGLAMFALRALPTTAAVAEPTMVVLTGSGLLSLLGYGWWRRKQAGR